jgi:hypothetical protein
MGEPRDVFEPLCISLVHQHLLSFCPNLAEEFNAKYKPKITEVELEQVLDRWEEAQLTKRLVYHYLECAAPSLVMDFSRKHGSLSKVSDYTKVTLEEVVAKWTEEQMIKGLVYQHLKAVAPDLASDFKDTHSFFFEDAPERFVQWLVKKTQIKNYKRTSPQKRSLTLQSNGVVEEVGGRKHMLGMKTRPSKMEI